MSVKSVYIEDQELAENISRLLAQTDMDISAEKIMNHYVTDLTNNLPADEQFIIESCVMQALGHIMSDISGNSGHQTCTCGAEWKFWYSRYGLEREPVNDLARYHDLKPRVFTLRVRLTEEERKQLQSRSDEKGTSMSEYVRRQIFPTGDKVLTDYDAAEQRIQKIPELQKYEDILLKGDWNEPEHFRWVATGSLTEILDWCEVTQKGIDEQTEVESENE